MSETLRVGYVSASSSYYNYNVRNLIVKVEIIGKHDEDREGVVDKNYARFNCSKAKVLDIYTKEGDEKIYWFTTGFEAYQIGEIVEDGVYYYLTEDAAYWDGILIDSGEVKEYCDFSGVLTMRRNKVDGKLHGDYEYYHFNGQLMSKCTYKDGKKNGEHKTYYGSGKLKSESTYKDGVEDGKVTSYHESGLIEQVHNVVDGNIEGEVVDYYDERNCLAVESKHGAVRQRIYAVKGTRQMSTTYHKDGTVNERVYYVDGKPIPACMSDKIISLEDKVKALEETIEELQREVDDNGGAIGILWNRD